ncbi:MAG: fimbrillin family protein [Candidatus Cryptobacteroides sp.]
MNTRYRIIVSALSVLLLAGGAISCRKNGPSEISMPSDNSVRWGVEGVMGYATKSLAEDESDLQDFCTPEEQGGNGRKIGVWADYNIEIDGKQQTVSNVFSGTQLYYNPSSSATDTKWEYSGDPAFWVPGGKYVFRAYYPAGDEKINIHENSTAKVFILEYNTLTTQRDLLLAFNSYDTVTKEDAKGNIKEMSDPVMFNFKHAMSALRFVFKFYEDADPDKTFYSTDHLTACWLETTADEVFAVTGLVTYGNDTEEEGTIGWFESYAPDKGMPIYKWENADGVLFENIKGGSKTYATAYSAKGATGVGDVFTEHDGWLLIVPQKSEYLTLKFKTTAGKEAVFSLAIPSKTGTSVAADGTVTESADGTDFAPGWRYTYTISITKTDAQLTLGISPWNRLDSSYDITF